MEPTDPNTSPEPQSISTFRDPALSLWQASVHAALVDQAAASPDDAHAAATADHPYMAATVGALQNFAQTGEFQPPKHRPSTAAEVAGCAKLYSELAWKKMFHPEQARELENELTFSTCDPLWAKCLLDYHHYMEATKHQPYTVHAHLSDYVLNVVPDKATVALIADWGTGMDDAVVLAQQIAVYHKPDVLIHLGDVYYAGLPIEFDRHFLQPLAKAWPTNPPLIFVLDGNHDRYAGAAGGYYSVIANLNQPNGPAQPASYFALRNNFWQLLSLDTGYHDADPSDESKDLTYLEPSEVEWHLDKIKNNGLGVDTSKNPSNSRGTVLLSHHQLYSFQGAGSNELGQPYAINPKLAGAFQSVFPQIALWLWGHEHNLCIFEPYTMAEGITLPRGRCLGAGAVPNLISTAAPPPNLILPPSETAPPRIIPGTHLRNNGTIDNHAYAILHLDGPNLTIDYYQFDSTKFPAGQPPPPDAPTYTETATTPK